MTALTIDKSLASLEREGLDLYGFCGNCGHMKDIPLQRAIALYGRAKFVYHIRGKCTACGAGGQEVRVDWKYRGPHGFDFSAYYKMNEPKG